MIPTGLPDQFMNWKLVPRTNPKTGAVTDTKVPCSPSGENADAHDPKNWLSYEQAAANGRGVAFSFTENDPWFFLDLDKCLIDGQWTPQASAIFQSFTGAWGELSQSGKGLHVMGQCDKSKLLDRRNKWDGWLEFYIKERFIAFGSTGWSRIGGVEVDRDWTDHLLNIVPEREFLGELPVGIDPRYTGPEDDDKLIQMMLRSASTASQFGEALTLAELWNADAAKLAAKYPDFHGNEGYDASSADMALMSHLAFWTGKDMPRMDRLFRRSGLMRDKYDNREDYRKETIQKAARLTRNVFDRPPPATKLPTSVNTGGGEANNGEVFLSIPEMITHFEGCVYVRDSHRIFVPDGAMLKPEQFNVQYGGHWFTMLPDGTKPSKKAFEAFTENACHQFPRAITTCFKPDRPPGEIIDDRVNIYVKPTMRVEQGDVTPFLAFMERLLPDERDREIVISFMAATVQYPGVKFQWAPVLQGVEGNGKTMCASCVAYAVGDHYSHMPRSEQLGEKFNSFVEGKIFILVEEIHMAGRREMLDILKPSITNRRVEIRPMHGDKRMIDNTANWFFCTNYKDAVLKSKNDRRYAIFYTAQQEVEDIERDGLGGSYFPSMYDWLDREGYAFMAHWLRNYPIRDELNPAKLCHRAPKTTATSAAIAISLGSIEQEIVEARESGRKGFCGEWISSHALDGLLKERNMRIAKSKVGTILSSLGYTNWGRSPRPILHENNLRPSLWYIGDPSTVRLEDYLAAQGWT